MNRGTNIGVLARDYFPGGVMAVEGEYPSRESAIRTQELIDQGVETIYEATFIYDDTLVAVDILTKIEGNWQLFECKGSTAVKPHYIRDLAVQLYVVTGAGIPLADAFVMHLNNTYVRRGSLDIHELFTCESVFGQAMGVQDDIPQRLMEFREMLQGEEPRIEIGKHCNSPYPCDYMEYCQGLLPISDIEPVSETDNSPMIRHDSVRQQLAQYGYPLYFLDFETIQPAVPLFDESRPCQQIPFQYSLHYLQEKGGELIHSDFLAWPEGDPRPDLIRNLIEATRGTGKILTYNVTFDRWMLREMARDFPEYSVELQEIISRLEDLMPVFRRRDYYFPSMGRGYSIKTVLPLMVPELSYNELEINNGGDASSFFLQLYESNDTELIEQTRQNLLKYCHLDTLAMVRILGELEERLGLNDYI
ncbi:MAG: DUF2779 domain-containing protein [Bacteroidia bacterium]|nr:DUF2779 domain-containing protein [Bacteroidia bacterium]